MAMARVTFTVLLFMIDPDFPCARIPLVKRTFHAIRHGNRQLNARFCNFHHIIERFVRSFGFTLASNGAATEVWDDVPDQVPALPQFSRFFLPTAITAKPHRRARVRKTDCLDTRI
ncbi:hypothetical protein ATY79_26815 [Rhizobium sp. R693]|nr:hypothetical protein ATY79_26815 [Rhizobium sp. R693]